MIPPVTGQQDGSFIPFAFWEQIGISEPFVAENQSISKPVGSQSRQAENEQIHML